MNLVVILLALMLIWYVARAYQTNFSRRVFGCYAILNVLAALACFLYALNVLEVLRYYLLK